MKNNKSKTNFGSSVTFEVNHHDSSEFDIKETKEEKIPTCPMCGNTEMNYYITEKQIWKCSKAYLHGNSKIVNPLLKYVA